MLKPNFRFFIIPLGAICTLASLSAQNTAPRVQRDSGMTVREQVVPRLRENAKLLLEVANQYERERFELELKFQGLFKPLLSARA